MFLHSSAFPGPPLPPKVVSAFDDCINLSWSAPSNTGGSRILGYILEKRKKGSNLWTVVNTMDELIKGECEFTLIALLITTVKFLDVVSFLLEKKYAVKDVVTGIEYEFRVTAINLSGPGEFSSPSDFVFARDPKSKCYTASLASYTSLILHTNKYNCYLQHRRTSR